MQLSGSIQRKLVSILLATAIFTVLGGLLAFPLGVPVSRALIVAPICGVLIGLFEEFYVQSRAGRWVRGLHPLNSILVYTAFVVAVYIVVTETYHVLVDPPDEPWGIYRRFAIILPGGIAIAVVSVLAMRVIHFIGPETLFHLVVGTYHRPVLEQKVIMFLDIKDSTVIVERLGALRARALIGKFLFDVSRPITDYGGDIYLYTGDGLIATWDWDKAIRGGRITRAIDAMFRAIEREAPVYNAVFGTVPVFCVGVHGGEVVISEQGDTKRAIGIYGENINIAARMEQAAKAHGAACILSGDVARALGTRPDRLSFVGEEHVKGITAPIEIYEYRIPRSGPGPRVAA